MTVGASVTLAVIALLVQLQLSDAASEQCVPPEYPHLMTMWHWQSRGSNDTLLL